MTTQPITKNTPKPRYTVVHRNWRDYRERESDYNYMEFNLDSRHSRQLDAYHALAERLLATGDWITHKNQDIPELFATKNPDAVDKNRTLQLERISANGIFTAADYTYNLILMRHYFKDGELDEMSITLPIGKSEDGLSVMVYTAIENRGHKLSLDDAVADLDAFITHIDDLYKKQAASADGMVHSTHIKHMKIDYDLLKERFLLQRVDDKNIPYSYYDELKVTSFGQAMFMNVSFVHENVRYDYRVDSTYYLKLLKVKEKEAQAV